MKNYIEHCDGKGLDYNTSWHCNLSENYLREEGSKERKILYAYSDFKINLTRAIINADNLYLNYLEQEYLKGVMGNCNDNREM